MTSFESDYNNGMLPEILQRLTQTNPEKSTGYGFDPYCESAREKIRLACGKPAAELFFLLGGTQTNATVIDSLLIGCEGVLTAETGHINVHESGAVEASGHKVLVVPGEGSKVTAAGIDGYMEAFHGDETYPHMVQPRLVYMSFPSELGDIYSAEELSAIYEVCKKHGLLLFVDGARLGYGLMSEKCDVSLPFLADHCDVFYIGGTKGGAMFGEAVVFSNIPAPKYFFTTVKRHGALLAKGRMLGIQFDTLFTDDLYFKAARHAIDMAERMKKIFRACGLTLYLESPTNQQFVILENERMQAMREQIAFSFWEKYDETHTVVRFATGWSMTEEDLAALERACAIQEESRE